MRHAVAVLLLTAAARADTVTQVAGPPAKLVTPFAAEFDRSGKLFFVELDGNTLRTAEGGTVTTVAGTGERGDGGDGGPGPRAKLNGPHNLAVAPDGTVYVADTWNNRVRKFDPKTGTVTTVAGTGRKGFAGDGGPAEKAEFAGTFCVALDPKAEKLYVADLDNRRVRAIDLTTRIVTTVAGNGKKGVPADGADAKDAPLVDPRAVAADAAGNVYVLERGGHALRVVDTAGRIRTAAGTGKAGHSGDGGPALRATFNGPKHLCVDRDGTVLIADTENHAVRRYKPADGTVHAVAGTGKKGTAGVGGPAAQCQLNRPHGVTVGPDGALYIADSYNGRVLRVGE